ncbi:DUF2335 domain-containing protein [Oceanivirga salmonicida]|uniref:DUF2335 domain-containing protein n=1 Tax=Oceanivirga salmonicida TaxID=1769291 RepID=UPI0008329282|nr:DUF2335 domain-containing protein [Oceanivirga salmonicida]
MVEEVIEKESIEEVDDNDTIMTSVEITYGPLPSPDILYQYKNVQPDAPDRIIKMAELQTENRVNMETKEQENVHKLRNEQSSRENQAQVFAFILLLCMVLGSLYLIYVDKEISGFITLGTTIITTGLGYLMSRK